MPDQIIVQTMTTQRTWGQSKARRQTRIHRSTRIVYHRYPSNVCMHTTQPQPGALFVVKIAAYSIYFLHRQHVSRSVLSSNAMHFHACECSTLWQHQRRHRRMQRKRSVYIPPPVQKRAFARGGGVADKRNQQHVYY